MMAHALIFDSGVGGLSVSAEIRRALPKLRQSYVADDAFRPYGEKSESALRARLPRLLAELEIMLAPDVIVIACNTASTIALPAIRAAVSVPVVGVVPAIKPAAEMSQSGAIGVLGTPGTVRQKYVGSLISKFAKDTHVALRGSVDLVELAEAKLAGEPIDPERLRAEISPLFSGVRGMDIDTIVLACTHFPLLRAELAAVSPRAVNWIDSGEAIARRVKSVLQEQAELQEKVGLDDQTQKTAAQNTSLPQVDTVFLIGSGETPAARRSAFDEFGFNRLVSLLPE